MKNNTSRLMVLCVVSLGFMLVGYDISFASTQSANLEAAYFVPAAEMPVNSAVTLKEETPSTLESAFKWVFLPTIVLGLFFVRSGYMEQKAVLSGDGQANTTLKFTLQPEAVKTTDIVNQPRDKPSVLLSEPPTTKSK